MEESHAEEAPCLFLNLPVEIISKIFSYTSYKHIGNMRSVCKVFNDVGSSILNTTFSRLQNVVQTRYHQIKSQMPRRESSRHNHPLAREYYILETVNMRLIALELTFGKHIERRNCCFFAGEILDEVYRICRYDISSAQSSYRVTNELFDLMTMATEYFREYIEPNLPDTLYSSSNFLNSTTACSLEPKSVSAVKQKKTLAMREEIRAALKALAPSTDHSLNQQVQEDCLNFNVPVPDYRLLYEKACTQTSALEEKLGVQTKKLKASKAQNKQLKRLIILGISSLQKRAKTIHLKNDLLADFRVDNPRIEREGIIDSDPLSSRSSASSPASETSCPVEIAVDPLIFKNGPGSELKSSDNRSTKN